MSNNFSHWWQSTETVIPSNVLRAYRYSEMSGRYGTAIPDMWMKNVCEHKNILLKMSNYFLVFICSLSSTSSLATYFYSHFYGHWSCVHCTLIKNLLNRILCTRNKTTNWMWIFSMGLQWNITELRTMGYLLALNTTA